MPTTLPDPASSAPRPNLGDVMERMRERATTIIVFGVLLALLGALALVFVVSATIASVYVNGIVMIVAGIVEMLIGYRAKSWGGFALWMLGGALYILAGAFAIANPVLAAAVLTLLLAAGLLAAGIVRLVLAFRMPAGAARTMLIVSGIIAALLGVMIAVGWPANSLFILGTLLGIDLIWHGVAWATIGWRLKARGA